MSEVSVTLCCDDRVARITLGVGEEGVGSDAGLECLGDCLAGLQRREPAVRALILTGSTPESFSLETSNREAGESSVSVAARMRQVATVFSALRRFPGATIAAVPGPLRGLALEMALNCDFRIATPALSVAFAPAREGRVPEGGASQLLPRLAGESVAKRLLMLGETLNGTRALETGIVDALVEAEALLPTATEWASRSLELDPVALTASKQLIEHARTRPLETGFATERDWMNELAGPSRD
ncbi:enoyl-CoA hydratase/carnithine racemase [Tamilnaduibacter salinus]|uniref:Enoyl-CoA hydratase/carnithine racemase n=1 Tax=Tamilnaduibacter salinus TaxID=1484056 RepID=A0A2U1CZX1_9GAMM|nr:enoyl-CoA hydratase/isomerase family protein [Tamilnaduibacter salinus]PVY78339.1 enoyl-CoA hydratase/carnithine racemase [Tamilnaduibacter salinus]